MERSSVAAAGERYRRCNGFGVQDATIAAIIAGYHREIAMSDLSDIE